MRNLQLFLYICVHVASTQIWDSFQEMLKAEEDREEIAEKVSVTEELMKPNMKIRNPTTVDESAEDSDPNWDKNKVIRDVAYFIRAHKFQDFDRRYHSTLTEVSRRLYEEFPKPILRALHWEVHKYCDKSFTDCLKYLERIVKLTSLKREDDTVTIMREQLWIMPNNSQQILATEKECQAARKRDNFTVVPFQGPIERFQWRTSVSYYMCWFTMLGIPDLALFGEPCDNHANCLEAYGANNGDPRADDAKPYACAEYSFCPDPCCPKKHIWSMKDCYQSPENPCYAGNSPDNRKCFLRRDENQEFASLVLNQLNVSCNCVDPGYEWSSRFGICVDINECSRGSDNCSAENGQSCINLPGNYDCICKLGFVYSTEKKHCVPSGTVRRALHEKVAEDEENKTKGVLTLIYELITRSSGSRFFTDFAIVWFSLLIVFCTVSH